MNVAGGLQYLLAGKGLGVASRLRSHIHGRVSDLSSPTPLPPSFLTPHPLTAWYTALSRAQQLKTPLTMAEQAAEPAASGASSTTGSAEKVQSPSSNLLRS